MFMLTRVSIRKHSSEGVAVELKGGGLVARHVELKCYDRVFVWTVKRLDLQIEIWHEYME